MPVRLGKDVTVVLASAPSSPVEGQCYEDSVTHKFYVHNGTAWVPLTKTFRTVHTWTIPGAIAVPVGDVSFIPPFFISLASGQTASLVKVRYSINSGTSVTAKLQKNGTDITGFTGISVTTTNASTTPTAVSVAEDDKIALVVTAVSGTPKNMSFTAVLEHVAA